jgi:glycosyltransferase involved in cell wall biosynthesis
MDSKTEVVSDLPTVTYLSMDPLTSTVGSSQVLAYVQRLARRGIDVDLVTFEHSVDSALQTHLSDLGVKWRPQRFGRPGAVAGLGRVLRAARVIRGAALVHARSDMAAASTMLAGIDRWVWDVRSLWVDQKVASGVVRPGSPPEKAMRWVERRAARQCSAVLTLTESAIDELDRRYEGVVSPKARVVTTCTDLDRFFLSPFPEPPLRVLLAGTLNRYYDLPMMLDLVAELRRRHPLEFIVASPGDTDWEDELEGLEVVRLSVPPDEMADLVSSCHIGLSVCRDDAGVSLRAAMPTKIAEFLASGRPVIVNPGLVDAASLLVRYECGVVFGSSEHRGVGAVVDQLEKQLLDPRTPDRCRTLAQTHFDLEQGVDHLVATYRSVNTGS